MKTSSIVLLAVGGYAVWKFAGLGVAANTVQIVLNGVTINSPLNYTIQLLIQNVSNATINVNAMAADVTVNGNDLGNVSDFVPVSVPGASQQIVNVTAKPSLLGIADEVISELQQTTGTFVFVVTGNANVNGLVLPFNLTKTITV